MSYNVITIEGRIVADGEARGKVGKVRVAVSSWRKDPNARPDSKFQNLTNWFTVVGFGDKATEVSQVQKNQIVRVTGSCEIVEFDDSRNPGQKRIAVEVHVGNKGAFEILEQAPRRDAGPSSYGPGQNAGAPAQRAPQAPPASGAGAEFFDDDVPF